MNKEKIIYIISFWILIIPLTFSLLYPIETPLKSYIPDLIILSAAWTIINFWYAFKIGLSRTWMICIGILSFIFPWTAFIFLMLSSNDNSVEKFTSTLNKKNFINKFFDILLIALPLACLFLMLNSYYGFNFLNFLGLIYVSSFIIPLCSFIAERKKYKWYSFIGFLLILIYPLIGFVDPGSGDGPGMPLGTLFFYLFGSISFFISILFLPNIKKIFKSKLSSLIFILYIDIVLFYFMGSLKYFFGGY